MSTQQTSKTLKKRKSSCDKRKEIIKEKLLKKRRKFKYSPKVHIEIVKCDEDDRDYMLNTKDCSKDKRVGYNGPKQHRRKNPGYILGKLMRTPKYLI